MELISSPLQVITTVLVLFLGMLAVIPFFGYFNVSKKRGLAIFFWHAFFSFVYALYVLNFGGDALHYYRASFNYNITPAFGTQGIVFFTSFFSVGLNLSLLGVFWIFHIFGVIGLLAFDGALKEVTANKSRKIRRLATLIIFLPSVSFWSSAIGKDSLSFMAMGLALWAAMKLNRRVVLMIIAVLVMLMVRPHIAGMMVIGLAGSMVFQRRTSIIQRMIFGAAALAATAVLVPLGLNYAGVGGDASSEDVMTYIEGRQDENTEGGASVDIANMSFPMKLFTYLFRPLPFEANSIFSLLASIDNMILMYLFVAGIRAAMKKKLPIQFADHNRIFLWIYCFLTWIVLAMTTANLGIAMRQKWMFAPMLIFLLISLIGKERKTITITSPDSANINLSRTTKG